jgi:hypothetical protein
MLMASGALQLVVNTFMRAAVEVKEWVIIYRGMSVVGVHVHPHGTVVGRLVLAHR